MNDLSDSDESLQQVAKKRKQSSSSKAKKRKKIQPESMIDDAAVLSGSESDSEEDEGGDDEANNDYIRDGFVVDEADDDKKTAEDGLEDSDDDDDDDDDEEIERRRRKLRLMRETDRLDEDDLALINEARGITKKVGATDAEERERLRIKARSENELKKGLFDASDDEDDRTSRKKGNKNGRRAVETFDEDGMDDFIEYDDEEARDTGRYRDDEDDGMMGHREGISEAQLNEANDIFGTDFLDFMADGVKEEDDDDDYEDDRERSYRERGVGVDLGVDSAEEDQSSDDDIFGSDDEEGGSSGLTSSERAEALRLKKEKRQLKKMERRKAAAKKKADRRKAKLRRAFEPVQLVENFCTERDDQIRAKDIPERFFDMRTPFHGPKDVPDITKNFSPSEEEEADWIMTRIPAIAAEYAAIEADFDMSMKIDGEGMEKMEKEQRAIIVSIMVALRYIHREHLEPEFIKKYREDIVTSPAVRENLYAIMDEDTEWERMLNAKEKVAIILGDLVKIAESDDALGADEDHVAKLKEDLRTAQERLDESIKDEERIQAEIGELDNDDDDDDLFGDDDDDDDKVS